MKNSRTSLNKPFYDWIKQVREADKKIKELEDKLYYYNVKLIGYNSPNFEPRLSSTKPEYKDNRYIWINKIEKTEEKITYQKKLLFQYKTFKNILSTPEKYILYCYLNKKKMNYPKSSFYAELNKVIRKFNKSFNCLKV